MKSSFKSRITALAAEIVDRRRLTLPAAPPLFVFEGEGTSSGEVRTARKRGRAVVYVCWKGEGRASLVVDGVPDYVTWASPVDCPLSVEQLEVNLATNEVISHHAEWARPELYAEEL